MGGAPMPRRFLDPVCQCVGYNTSMVRIRDILDPELRARIVTALAERRGCSAAAIPDWFELDDADFADLLADLKEPADVEPADDPRM